MPRLISVGSYLFQRLRQVGVDHIFGVPGDFTLKALDHVDRAGSKFIVNCNELNAGYAADGYARTRGLGALFTTYGVGELSAINAIAGSCAENVPVVHIVGLPQRHLINSRAIVHHTLGDGRTRVFKDMYKSVTAYRTLLDNREQAVDQIDLAILKAIRSSRPTYIGMPCDMVNELISITNLHKPLSPPTETDETTVDAIVVRLKTLLREAQRPVLLVDRAKGVDSLRDEINTFARESGIPTLTMPSGASMINHSLTNYFGVHAGPVSQFDTMPLIESADLLFEFGPMYSDTQTLGFSLVPDVPQTVSFRKGSIRVLDTEYEEVDVSLVLKRLASEMDGVKLKKHAEGLNLPNFRSFPIKTPLNSVPDQPITQDKLYLRLNSYLRPDDIILLANATPILGGRDFVLPDKSCRVIVSGLWFSIGHMLPAALGAALAQQDSNTGRVVLFDGDGSFQVSAQELSTIIRYRVNMTIFIINNEGYAYERLIHNAEAAYHDIAPWRYTELPRAFGSRQAAQDAHDAGEEYAIHTAKLRTWDDVEAFLEDERWDNGFEGKGKRGLRLVDIKVGRTDIPEKFKKVFESAGQKLG